MAPYNKSFSWHLPTFSVPRLFVLLICLLILPACEPAPDYDLYVDMGDFMQAQLIAAGAHERQDMPDPFKPGTDYIKRLRPLLKLIFGSSRMQVYLQSYESERIAVGSISQFEAPPGSDIYNDCAFVVRAVARIGAPVMHGDARAALAGTDEEFSMDFYNYDHASIDIDAFFGAEQLEKINTALALVEQYQIPELNDQGERYRGRLTAYLDPYKSPYRLELAAPKTGEVERQAYVAAALQAFKLYQEAYFDALADAVPDDDDDVVQARVTAMAAFIHLFETEDIAVKLGRLLFGKKDFPFYFNEGFWRQGYYGE